MPFVSKQKGRMTALLKQKSKIKIERKPRVQYPVGESLKRIRDPPKPAKATNGTNQGLNLPNADQSQSQAQTQS